MDAMKNDEIDIYPDYTGTALLLLLETNEKERGDLFSNPDKSLRFCLTLNLKSNSVLEWLPALRV